MTIDPANSTGLESRPVAGVQLDIPADVVELLDQLEDTYSHLKVALAAVWALTEDASSRHDRVLYASSWADLPHAREILASADGALSSAALELENRRGDALAILLEAGLKVFLDLAVGATPRRPIVASALHPAAPLGELRGLIAGLGATAIGTALGDALDEHDRWAIDRYRDTALAAIDHTIAADAAYPPQHDTDRAANSSLADLIGPGYPGDEAVITALSGLATTLTSIVRPRRVRPLPAGPLPTDVTVDDAEAL